MGRSGRLTGLGVGLLGVLAVLAVLAVGGAGPARAQQPPALSPQLRQQLAAALAEKAARTPAQRKLSSRLLFAERMRRGRAAVPGVGPLRTGVAVAADGSALVDLRADVTPRLLARIEALGGTVVSSHPRHRAVRARVPLARLEALAALDEVVRIRPADRAVTRKLDTSEGDVAHRADAARATFGVDGTGVTVGVLSDGVDWLDSLQMSGDLPAQVTVLTGQAGSGSEGTAMLEIVHDLAPGASLLFATAFGGQAAFADNIVALRDAGADVIVDDVAYFAEAVFQDDDVADAVNQVTAAGALYFSAAGNEGNWNDGTAGVWEGDFVFSGTVIEVQAPPGPAVQWEAADFGGGLATNAITADSPYLFTLHWSDPKGQSANDYDLFLSNSQGTKLVAISSDVQDGTGDPFEAISSSLLDDTDRLLLVGRYAGASRTLHLNANRGRLAVATPGQTSGHASARDAFAVAAVDARAPGGAGGVFDGSEPVESYSSDGPRRVFYEADGTPITPGDLSSTGGELRAKPDLAAADCVSTATPGFAPFCGTSAAAPHAAAVAALLLELGGPAATPAAVRAALAGAALDIEAPGADRDAGAGLVEALAAATAQGATDCSNGADDDGDGQIDLEDPGCDDAGDASEKAAALPCDDGLDDDGDGGIDFLAAGGGDLGCAEPTWPREDPACQDGTDDDGDGLVDFDGGQSLYGACTGGVCPPGVSDPDADGVADPDPQCVGKPWRVRETASACGLGAELALALGLLAPLRRARRPRRTRAGPRGGAVDPRRAHPAGGA